MSGGAGTSPRLMEEARLAFEHAHSFFHAFKKYRTCQLCRQSMNTWRQYSEEITLW